MTARQAHPADVLPHRPPMRMISDVLERDERSIHCTSILAPENPLLVRGRFPVVGGLELVAQAAGVLLGQRADAQPMRPGVIVQVKSYSTTPAEIPVGAELHIRARVRAGGAEAALVEGEAAWADTTFFSAVLMLALQPRDPA